MLVPFGQQASGSFSAEEQLAIAGYFLGGNQEHESGAASMIAEALAASGRRSPNVLSLNLIDGTILAYRDAGLRDFVQVSLQV